MIIKVGTKNKIKVQAVREIAAEYALGLSAAVIGVDVSSGVADQPKTLLLKAVGNVITPMSAPQACGS